MKTHGTATNGQYGEVLRCLIPATAAAIEGVDVKALLQALNASGGPLAHNLSLVFSAMMTGRHLVFETPQPELIRLFDTYLLEPTKRFVPHEYFKPGQLEGPRFTSIDNSFWSLLSQTEQDVPAREIRSSELIYDLPDAVIMQLLGEEFEITPSELWQIMEAQFSMHLLLSQNAEDNICYMRSSIGTLVAVSVSWDAKGWKLGLRTTVDPKAWKAGSRVLSAN